MLSVASTSPARNPNPHSGSFSRTARLCETSPVPMPLFTVCCKKPAVASAHGLLHRPFTVSPGFELRWQTECRCFPTQDNVTRETFERSVDDRPKDVPDPTKVGIICARLTPPKPPPPSYRPRKSVAMPSTSHGSGQSPPRWPYLYYADAMQAQQTKDAAPMYRFNHIPDLALEGDAPFLSKE